MSLEETIEDLIRELRTLTELISQRDRVFPYSTLGGGPNYAEEPKDLRPELEDVAEPEAPAIEGENPQVIELIKLAKELGYEYVHHEGKLVVDNRVMDEYNRRRLGDELGP